MTWISRSIFALLFASVLVVGCSETTTTPTDPDEGEVITTLQMVFKPISGGDSIVVVWQDLDGVGGNAPSRIDTIRLMSGVAYSTTITVLDETKTPPDNVTEEILDEAEEHQFFFSSTGNIAGVVYSDLDNNGNVIGQKVLVTYGASGNGTLTVELSHYDDPADKDGKTKSDETDIAVTFPVEVQ